jgi:hypothetical protein
VRYLARIIVVTGLATGTVWLGNAYNQWSIERHLRSAAANAAAPGIDLREFECQRYGQCDGMPKGSPRRAR